MDIEQIKKYIEEELTKGNEIPYKKLRSFCNKIYRFKNKDKVSVWNSNYNKKHTDSEIGDKSYTDKDKGHTDNSKKHTDETTSEIKRHTEIPQDIPKKHTDFNDHLNIFN